jgi:pyrroline-5-carboxylate reductase
MGSILAKNLVQNKVTKPESITVLKKTNKNKISHLNYITDIKQLEKKYSANLVFLCIKPQESEAILQQFSQAKIFNENTIFISIIAGKKIEFFEKIFGKKSKILRAMPNLPIEFSQGIFSYLGNKNIKSLENKNLQQIFKNFGLAFELKDENLFDVATALYGSGPAYFFLLAEIFVEISESLGIKKKMSIALTKKLIFGSALMLERSNDEFSKMRSLVTSKGGTTESALKILLKNSALKNLFKKTVDTASRKSKELSKS